MTELTQDEKTRLKALLESEDWKLVSIVYNDMLESARSFCEEKPPVEVAKFQGIAYGLRQFMALLAERARVAPVMAELTSPTMKFKSSFGRSAAGGY